MSPWLLTGKYLGFSTGMVCKQYPFTIWGRYSSWKFYWLDSNHDLSIALKIESNCPKINFFWHRVGEESERGGKRREGNTAAFQTPYIIYTVCYKLSTRNEEYSIPPFMEIKAEQLAPFSPSPSPPFEWCYLPQQYSTAFTLMVQQH